MRNKILLIFLFIFFVFCFFIFYKSINNTNSYKPNIKLGKILKNFDAIEFFSENEINSNEIFVDNKYYIINIWATWCAPCRKEHPKLIELSKKKSAKLIGINYKDNLKKAKKFIGEFGNPFSVILFDKKGILAIELGAYGIPETYIIDENKKILKKYLGALTNDNLKEINSILK